MSFKELHNKMSEENKILLDKFVINTKFITNQPETEAITRALHLLSIFLITGKENEIKDFLSKPVTLEESNGTFEYKQLVIDTPDEAKIVEKNIKDIIGIKKFLSDQIKATLQNGGTNLSDDEVNDKIVRAFLFADVGKSNNFIQLLIDKGICDSKNIDATRHDFYREEYLKQPGNENDKLLYQLASRLSTVFEGLGYNHHALKTQANYAESLRGIMRSSEFLNTRDQETAIAAFNQNIYFLGIDFGVESQQIAFLMDSKTATSKWSKLDKQQQSLAVMIHTAAPLVFVDKFGISPASAIKQFMHFWRDEKYAEYVQYIIDFFVMNSFSEDPVFIYNTPGLTHHINTRLSHFSVGGTVLKYLTCLLPFVVDVARGKSDVKIIERQSKVFSEWQPKQSIESFPEMLRPVARQLQGISPEFVEVVVKVRSVDFGSTLIKEKYFKRFADRMKYEKENGIIDESISAKEDLRSKPHHFLDVGIKEINFDALFGTKQTDLSGLKTNSMFAKEKNISSQKIPKLDENSRPSYFSKI